MEVVVYTPKLTVVVQCDRKHIKHKQVYFFWTLRDAAAVHNFKSTFAVSENVPTQFCLCAPTMP